MSVKQVNETNVTEERELHSYLTVDSVLEDIEQLKQSVNEIELQVPDEVSWGKITNRINTSASVKKLEDKQTKTYTLTKQLVSMAATISFLFIGWLGGSNYQLQSQLTMALKINQGIELQLAEYIHPKRSQVYLLQKINAVEDKLTTEQ